MYQKLRLAQGGGAKDDSNRHFGCILLFVFTSTAVLEWEGHVPSLAVQTESPVAIIQMRGVDKNVDVLIKVDSVWGQLIQKLVQFSRQ